MNGTTTLAFVTGTVVVVGRWVQKKPVDAKIAIGVGFYALLLSMIDNANHEIAVRLAALTLLVAFLSQGVAIMQALGLVK